LDKNAIETKKHIYDHLITDSNVEREFAKELEGHKEVSIYAKLPKGFFINTPVGNYNPDWAIVFDEKDVKHVYFIAETKGSLDSLEFREVEKAKIECAKKHFSAISDNTVKYDVVDSYDRLMDLVKS
jgi:type III restriction enzyme